MGAAVPVARAAGRPLSQRVARMFDRWLLPIYATAAVLYLMLPVAVMIAFSFNNPAGKFNLTWHEFSLAAWQSPLAPPGLAPAVGNSILIAFLSTIFATILGTLIALALVRHRFRGRGATNLLIFLPMSTPEIVLGSSLLTLFIATNQYAFIPLGSFYPLGLHTILIAHIMFNISFVVVTVKARVEGFPRNLEEAGAGPLRQRVDGLLEGHLPADPARDPGSRAAVLQPVDRRFRDHELHRRPGYDLPALDLRCPEDRGPGPGQRHRLDHLPERGRPGRAVGPLPAPLGGPGLSLRARRPIARDQGALPG